MNQFENDTNGALVDTTPLFASTLLTMFCLLRKNFNERRLPDTPADGALQGEEE